MSMLGIATLVAAFNLVGEKQAARVVLAENPEPSAVLAAEELTNYVFKITGRPIDISHRLPTADRRLSTVLIGTLDKFPGEVPAAARAALEKAKQFEASWTSVKDGRLYIVGKEATAELYATYHFLETKLGVRWFQADIPEDPGDWYPAQKTIVINNFTEFREPDFKYRLLCMNGCYYNIIAKPGIACAIRNGFQFNQSSWWIKQGSANATSRDFNDFFGPRVSKRNIHVGGGHGIFFETLPKEKYFPLHPEWFPLHDGKRQVRHGHYCISNTNMLQAVVDIAIENLRLTGGLGQFSFSQVDNIHGWCECEECRKLDGPGEGADGSHVNVSSRICFMANYIGPRILAAWPQATMTVFPYSVYRDVPTRGAYDSSFECQYCDHGRCYGHVLDDPNCIRNVNVLKEMKVWLKATPKLYTFEYFTDTPPLYVCRERDEQADLKLYKSLGMIGWFNEGFMTGSKFVGNNKNIGDVFPSNWQWCYATGHLLWDTDLDLDALLADAESKYYGKAYGPMKEYNDLRRKLWNSRRECMGYPSGDARRPLLLNAEGAKERLLDLLDTADKLARGNKALGFRLSRDRRWLNEYWIKPNDKARTMASNALRIPKITSPIKIDGDKSDAAWLGALYPNDRLKLCSEREPGKGEIPDALKTSVGMATDGESLFFLIEANEPHMDRIKNEAKERDGPAWGDDGVELMIFSPSVENCYYHIAVNTAGVVYDARCPGNEKQYDLGVEAKGGKTDKGWFLEVKVPTQKIYPLLEGDKWRLQVVRNSTTCGQHGGSVSLGGYLPHVTEEYPTFEFGSSCVINGAFDDTDENGKPKGWTVYSGEIRKEGANNVLFTKSFTAHSFRHGPLGKSPEARKLKYSFRAKGKGKVKVGFVRYDDDKQSGAWMPEPWGKGGEYELTDNWRTFTGDYTINPGEYISIAFTPPPEGCFIDDVNVTKGEE